MKTQKLLLILSIFALIFSVLVGFTLAQDEEEEIQECSYFDVDENQVSQGEMSFDDCALTLFSILEEEDELEEANGYWGDYLINVNWYGEIYYAEDTEEPEWIFWDELDVDGGDESEDEGDDSEEGDDGEGREANTLPFDELMELAETDIDSFWIIVFENEEMEYERPTVVIFEEETIDTACDEERPAENGPFYCGGDHTVYFPVPFMLDQYERIGDFAPVLIVAHEWGHAMQMVYGLMEDQFSIDIELQADCLAGAYSHYVANESEIADLSENDIDEGMQSLFEVGDSDDTEWFADDAHGTSEERQEAFMNGFENGIEACFGTESE